MIVFVSVLNNVTKATVNTWILCSDELLDVHILNSFFSSGGGAASR